MQRVRPYRLNRNLQTKLSRKRRKKSSILSQTYNDFIRFCEQSSLHGLKHVGRMSDPWITRFLWALAFLLASALATYFIWSVYNEWNENPIMMTISSKLTNIHTLPFPAVTICPLIFSWPISVDEVAKWEKEKDWNTTKDFVEYVCYGNTSFPKDRKDEFNAFLDRKASCEDLFIYVYFNNEDEVASKMDLIYNNGHCCTFNAVRPEFMFRNISNSGMSPSFEIPGVDWNLHTGYPPNTKSRTVPLRPNGTDIENGLTFVLKFISYCRKQKPASFLLYIHSPTELYTIHQQNLRIITGNDYLFSVIPRIIDSADSIRSVKPEKRGCYFDDEIFLDFFKRYSKEKCEINTKQIALYKKCGCLRRDYLPDWILPNTSTTCNWNKCRMEDDFTPGDTFHCLPGCSELSYSVLEKSFPNNQNGYALVDVFFIESNIHAYYRSEFISFNGFVANIGGLLGLFLGFSFLSVVEIIYFIALGLAKMCHKKMKVSPPEEETQVWKVNSIMDRYQFSNPHIHYRPRKYQ